MKKLFPYPWRLSLWFWWLITTLVYIGLQFSGLLKSEGGGASPLSYAHGFLGLFVPFGVWNGIAVLQTFFGWGLLAVALFIVMVFGGDTLISRYGVTSGTTKVFYNLLVLLILTLLVDVIFYGGWQSWTWFTYGGDIPLSF